MKTRALISVAILIAAILAVAYGSNKALDALGIADDMGVTIEQRKERARERQWDWDHYREKRSETEERSFRSELAGKPDAMCTDARVLSFAKALINDQHPSLAKLAPLLTGIETARTDPGMYEKQLKNLEQEKQFYTSRLPDKDAVEELKRIETRTANLKEREKWKQDHAAAPEASYRENQVFLTGEPYPIEYDRDLRRVLCRIQFKISGPAYETINAMRGNVSSTAVYSVQPGRTDWIVELLSASGIQ